MARLFFRDGKVQVEATEGEEVSPEFAQAWAALKSNDTLENISALLSELADEVARLGDNGS